MISDSRDRQDFPKFWTGLSLINFWLFTPGHLTCKLFGKDWLFFLISLETITQLVSSPPGPVIYFSFWSSTLLAVYRYRCIFFINFRFFHLFLECKQRNWSLQRVYKGRVSLALKSPNLVGSFSNKRSTCVEPVSQGCWLLCYKDFMKFRAWNHYLGKRTSTGDYFHMKFSFWKEWREGCKLFWIDSLTLISPV